MHTQWYQHLNKLVVRSCTAETPDTTTRAQHNSLCSKQTQYTRPPTHFLQPNDAQFLLSVRHTLLQYKQELLFKRVFCSNRNLSRNSVSCSAVSVKCNVNSYLDATKRKYSNHTIHHHLSRQSAVNQTSHNVGTKCGCCRGLF
jgi:hypothetical protein